MFTQCNLVCAAKALADIAHHGQCRRDKVTPYFTHLERVADRVDYALKPIAWLHDIVEDTAVTLLHLEALGFPEWIIAAVGALTHLEGEPYVDYLKRVKSVPDALVVKFADIRDNLSDNPTGKQVEKYKEALKFLEKP